jgi:hypothetical protein
MVFRSARGIHRVFPFPTLMLFLLCCIPTQAQQISSPSTAPRLLTRIEQIWSLDPDEAQKGHSVRVTGVVTYFDDRDDSLFIQDDTTIIYVNPSGGGFRLLAGQLVEVEGVSAPGDYAPIIAKPRIRILGTAPIPAAHRASLEQLMTGKEDSQLVEVEGIVRSVSEEKGRIRLGYCLQRWPL